MSYEKVRSISIKDNKVFINCASNNCRPLDYRNEEYPYFTKILQEKGKQELDISLLKSYEEGNLQEGKNKYTQALKVLYYFYFEEYKKFSWRNNGEDYERAKLLRETQDFKDLLIKCLNYKFSKQKYLLTKNSYGTKFYALKTTTRHLFYTENKEKAKLFDFEREAQAVKSCYNNANLEIEVK